MRTQKALERIFKAKSAEFIEAISLALRQSVIDKKQRDVSL